MLWDMLKTKQFNLFFSVIIGIGLAAVLKPICKGDKCVTLKAPPVAEINTTTYQLGNKCYQFKTESTSCPKDSKVIIEAFQIDYSGWFSKLFY